MKKFRIGVVHFIAKVLGVNAVIVPYKKFQITFEDHAMKITHDH